MAWLPVEQRDVEVNVALLFNQQAGRGAGHADFVREGGVVADARMESCRP
jgi:hypothetical protein